MNIYLAGSYGRRLELLGYARELEALGHTVTSSWLDGHQETRPDIDDNGTDDERAMWAREDLDDLRLADMLIAFTEKPAGGGRKRGGRHVEFGVALERGIDLMVVGPRENVFHSLPWIPQFDTWCEALEQVRRLDALPF